MTTRAGWCGAMALVGLVGCGSSKPPREATPEEMKKLYPELGATQGVHLSKAEPHPSRAVLGAVTSRGAAWGSPEDHYFKLMPPGARGWADARVWHP